jgi:capsular exopolysaccharide synthesis family protein
VRAPWSRRSNPETGSLDPSGERDEALRVLRSNLLVAMSDLQNPIVVVTSANAGEGKTSTCVPLATSFALAGFKVVLVDLDLRHPDAHRLLGCANEVGVADVLAGRVSVQDALQFVDCSPTSGIYFLPTGPSPENPTELLGARRTLTVLQSLAEQADLVLIDSAPVLPVADTLVISRFAAGALLVVEAGHTPIAAVQRAKDALIRNQTRILGLVLNRVRAGDSVFGYGYGYGYGAGPAGDAGSESDAGSGSATLADGPGPFVRRI